MNQTMRYAEVVQIIWRDAQRKFGSTDALVQRLVRLGFSHSREEIELWLEGKENPPVDATFAVAEQAGISIELALRIQKRQRELSKPLSTTSLSSNLLKKVNLERLEMLVAGLDPKEVSVRQGVSPNTIWVWMRGALKAHGLSKSYQAAAWALLTILTSEDPEYGSAVKEQIKVLNSHYQNPNFIASRATIDYSEEDLLDLLRWLNRSGIWPTTGVIARLSREGRGPSIATYQRTFGGLPQARVKAGIQPDGLIQKRSVPTDQPINTKRG